MTALVSACLAILIFGSIIENDGFKKGLNSPENKQASIICAERNGILEFNGKRFVKCGDDNWFKIILDEKSK